MRIELIVANGCSCTRGEELAAPGEDAWPTVLGSLLGVEMVNVARDGSSNRRIVRSNVLSLERLAHERRLSPGQVLSLSAWTEMSRSEYFSSTETDERRNGPGDTAVDRGWQRIGSWRAAARHRPSRAFYRHLWSDESQLLNFLLDWTMYESWCSGRGFATAYAFAFPLPPVDRAGDTLEALQRMLPLDKTWGGALRTEGFSMLEMPDELARGTGGHPLKDGHAWFARRLADWLEASWRTPS